MTMASQMSANAAAAAATSNTTTTTNTTVTTNVTKNSTTNSQFGNNGTNDREVNSEQMTKELNGNGTKETNSNVNIGANNLRGADAGKRKKLKSRNIPTTTANVSYSKDHLDAWLETCLKDVSQEQLSSSSEFLDYNPTTSAATKAAIKQKQNMMSSLTMTNANNSNVQQQQNSQQPGMFANMRNNTKIGGLTSNYGAGGPFGQGFQRSMPNFMKSPGVSAYHTNRFSNMFPSSSGNHYGPLNDSSQDFASLPPIVNLLGNYASNNGGGVSGNNAGSSEHENSTDVLDGSGSNPNMSRGFRFSDPCLLNPSDNDSKLSGRNTPDLGRPNVPNDMENNKFFVALMEQINLLHESNSKICRNLHETKVDIEALKHAPTWGIRHRRDSLSGLSAQSQPVIFGGGFGTQSPAPTYHSGAYTPGSVTEVVREVKEAARVREDALLSRVKALVEERQWSLNEANLRMMRDIEELKSQINFLRSDRKESNKRITHLEAENKYMRQLLASIYNSNRNMQHNKSASGKNLQNTNARRTQALHLNYGTIHHQATSSLSLEEQDEEEPLHIIEPPIRTQTERAKQQQQQQQLKQSKNEMRSSFSSSDGGSNGHVSLDNTNVNKMAMSPPKFALITSPNEPTQTPMQKTSMQREQQQQQQPLQKPKRKNKENALKKQSSDESLQQFKMQQEHLRRPSTDSSKTLTTQDLQRELNDAVAARSNADARIIAIEKLVQNLHVNSTQPTFGGVMGDGDNGGASGNINHSNSNQMHHQNMNSHKQQPKKIAAAQNANNTFKQHSQTTNIIDATTPTNMNNSTALNSTPKLSVAGPITDL